MPLRRRTSDLGWLAGGIAVLLATGMVAARGIADWELDVFRVVNGLPATWWPWVWAPMQFGSYAVVPLLAVGSLLFGRRVLAVELFLAGSLAWAAARVAKIVVDRPRPGALLDDVWLRGVGTTGGGFPSGHAAVSAALAFVLFAWLPRRWGWAVVGLAVAVAVLRLYAGAHLPLDVIGGAGVGAAAGAVTTWVLRVPTGADDPDAPGGGSASPGDNG